MTPSEKEDADFCTEQLTTAARLFEAFRATYTDPTRIPRSAGPSGARLVSVNDWTSGFVAGTFWLLFEHTRDPLWRETAETWTAALEGQRLRTQDHDVGFIINNTFGNGYRLTANTAYRDVLQTAASSLATRFDSRVGAIRSWDFGSWWSGESNTTGLVPRLPRTSVSSTTPSSCST